MSEMGHLERRRRRPGIETSANETSVCSSLASWKHGPTWDDALGDGEQGEAVPQTGGLDDGSVVVSSPCK